MNYNLRTLYANFSRGNSSCQILLCSVWGLFHSFLLFTHNHNRAKPLHPSLLQPIFSRCGEWEPCGPWWQVWIIPVIFRLKHYSSKENTYYPSWAVSTHSDPLTPACSGGHYSFNVPFKPQTHRGKLITTHDPTKLHWEPRAQNEHRSYEAMLSLFCTSPRQGHVDLEGKSSAK